ncbi:hypothetical protein ACFY36_43835 [Actinoplanes sp. NPDC000266]
MDRAMPPPGAELLAKTTYRLIRPFEAMALLLQATNLFASPLNDRYRPFGVPVVLGLAVVHLILAGLVLRHRGPLTRGRAWAAAWIASIFTVQMLLAHLLAPGDFAAYGVGVPMGNYALIPLAVFAFYPWGGFRNATRRRLTEGILIIAVVLHPLFIVGVMNRWHFTDDHVRSIVQYAGWALVWFMVGKGMAWLCRIAVRAVTEALSESYDAAVGDLHTHVEIAADKIAAGHDVQSIAIDLRQLITARRRQLLLRDANVSAASLFTNAIRSYGDRLTVGSVSRIGALTIPAEHAILLEQGLADLLKNVVQHGGGAAHVGFTLEDELMILDVRDSGPGLERREFAVAGTSLHRLRSRLRERGGNLVLLTGESGAAVRLTLPLRTQR